LRRAPVEARRLVFHFLGGFADVVEPKRTVEPDRMALDEALHVLAPDQRQKFAEFLAVELEQHVVMADLLRRHLVVHRRRIRVRTAKAIRKRAVDAIVLVLIGNGERQNFSLAQIGKTLHGAASMVLRSTKFIFRTFLISRPGLARRFGGFAETDVSSLRHAA
jgi:hypothetical protein